MGYMFEEKFRIGDALTIKKVMYSAIEKHSSFNAFQRSLVKTGFSYRRVEMLEDWHRASGAAISRTWEGAERSLKWWDEIFKPMQKERGESVSQTLKFIHTGEKGDLETEEDFHIWLGYEKELAETFEGVYE